MSKYDIIQVLDGTSDYFEKIITKGSLPFDLRGIRIGSEKITVKELPDTFLAKVIGGKHTGKVIGRDGDFIVTFSFGYKRVTEIDEGTECTIIGKMI